MFSDIWLKIAGFASVIAALFYWRQKGIDKAVDKAVDSEKAKSRLKESKIHIKKMEKEKADAKTTHEIETLVASLDNDERTERLQSFRGKHDDNNA